MHDDRRMGERRALSWAFERIHDGHSGPAKVLLISRHEREPVTVSGHGEDVRIDELAHSATAGDFCNIQKETFREKHT